jgi:hypothetical protein
LSDQEQIYVDDLRQNITTGREEEWSLRHQSIY